MARCQFTLHLQPAANRALVAQIFVAKIAQEKRFFARNDHDCNDSDGGDYNDQ